MLNRVKTVGAVSILSAILLSCSGGLNTEPTIKERAVAGFETGGWDKGRITTRKCYEIFPNFFQTVGEMRSMKEAAAYFTANGIPADSTAPAHVGDISESQPVKVKITYYGISSMFGDMDPHDMEVAACFLDL